MPKFRTMEVGTPLVKTNKLSNPEIHNSIRKIFKKSSLDELPQLISILRGEMSFVDQPALYNQYELIKLRKKYGINRLTPGLTGWAQVNGRDNITLKKKIRLEKEYLKKISFFFDAKILFKTLLVIFISREISH